MAHFTNGSRVSHGKSSMDLSEILQGSFRNIINSFRNVSKVSFWKLSDVVDRNSSRDLKIPSDIHQKVLVKFPLQLLPGASLEIPPRIASKISLENNPYISSSKNFL